MSGNTSSEDDFLEDKAGAFSDFIYGNRINIFLLFLGLILLGSGLLIIKNSRDDYGIEVVESTEQGSDDKEIIVEIAGAVEKPGVYKLTQTSRVEDLLIASGGLSTVADRQWVERYVNRAAIMSDGQKFYIPTESEQSGITSANFSEDRSEDVLGEDSIRNKPININTASQKELETLTGIGPVYAQNIIEHRPYSTVEELLSKGALKSFVYEKIKDNVNVY